ncbi:MAG: DNA-directed RNA polymerase subunit omega [Chloroflexota bacterium]
MRLSIVDPSIDRLVKTVPNKYLLVVGAARRGREIMDGDAPLVASKSNKPVTIAMQEIVAGTVKLTAPQGGVK